MRRIHNGYVLSSILAVTALAVPEIATADARTEARRHFRHGMDLVVAGQIDAGVAELEEAYAILPHPNVLYNIGRAYAEVGRYDEARDYFDRYLESDPPDREEVRAIVAAIDQRIAARTAAATTTTSGTTTATTPTTSVPTTTTLRVVGASPEQIAEIRATATQSGATCIAERLPADQWAGFTTSRSMLEQRIKKTFDPANVLNPGIPGVEA